jgi:hypothetical protein
MCRRDDVNRRACASITHMNLAVVGKITPVLIAICVFAFPSLTAGRLSTPLKGGTSVLRLLTSSVTTTQEDLRGSTQFCYLPSEPCESDHRVQEMI